MESYEVELDGKTYQGSFLDQTLFSFVLKIFPKLIYIKKKLLFFVSKRNAFKWTKRHAYKCMNIQILQIFIRFLTKKEFQKTNKFKFFALTQFFDFLGNLRWKTRHTTV